MRHLLTISMIFGLLFAMSCTSEKQTENRQILQQKISSAESRVLLQDGTLLADSAQKLISLYSNYSVKFPEDSIAAEYLFKAIDISLNLPQPRKTLELIDRYIVLYPNDSRAGTALFFKAFLHDQQLGDLPSAKQYYEQFLAQYPNHDFVDDAQA
ncbi:MAG: hypothetical protein K8F24_05450, partial [Bacteroidales bacterium]|nr:hypothetical protein [Bacteroidales bacterium]